MVLVVLLLFPLAAFGGTRASAAIPFGVGSLVYFAIARPHLRGALDRTLLVLIASGALTLAPLPRAVVDVLSPAAYGVRADLALGSYTPRAFQPLSLSASETAWAMTVFAGAVALFWTARQRFSRGGGVRRMARAISAIGFAVSVLAVAQAATAGREIYWLFPTPFEGPLPFGPFINRNHFGTWVIMALPLCFGYIAARAGSRENSRAHANPRARLPHLVDPRSAWLTTAAGLLLLALLLSLSRSAALALGVSSAATLLVTHRHLGPRRRRWVLATLAVVVVLGVGWADIPALGERLAGARTGIAGRVTIWRETGPIVRDFWLTGTGAGTYQTAMRVYQRSDRTVYFNQAHNHYVQVAAEGGVLLTIPVAVAIVLLVRRARHHLDPGKSRRRTENEHDSSTTGVFWIRTGAACGLLAVALQSVWETGLVMPANAALAAVLCAILVHDHAGAPAHHDVKTSVAPGARTEGGPR